METKEKKTRYCLNCYQKRPYTVYERPDVFDIRGTHIPYIEKYAVCDVCKDELYVPEISGENTRAREAAYNKYMEMEN